MQYNFSYSPLRGIALENKMLFSILKSFIGIHMPHNRSVPPRQHVKNYLIFNLLFLKECHFHFLVLSRKILSTIIDMLF